MEFSTIRFVHPGGVTTSALSSASKTQGRRHVSRRPCAIFEHAEKTSSTDLHLCEIVAQQRIRPHLEKIGGQRTISIGQTKNAL